MEFNKLIEKEITAGIVLDVATAALSTCTAGGASYTVYLDALRDALAQEPPPFDSREYASLYEAAAKDGQWLAVSLITNAEREGDGATRLWSLAASSTDSPVHMLLKRHAIDESRHARAYIAILDLAFPGAVEPILRAELNQLSPGYTQDLLPVALPDSPYARSPSLDDFVQMNIAEIRTTLHHLMQRRALAAICPPANLARMTRILDSLLRDEINHVAYTAALINAHARGARDVTCNKLFCKRMRDFNRITSTELGQAVFE